MVNNYYLCNVLIKEEEMKTSRILFLITILATTLVSCQNYDIAAENADGVTIYYNLSNDGKELKVSSKTMDFNSYSGDVVIPEEVTYKGVTRKVTGIELWAFEECKELASVTIPSSVTDIKANPFHGCGSLTSIIVDAANPKYDSRDSCNAIIETESNRLISGCQNTIIPDGVTSIGMDAFYNCSGLTSITIPNSVEIIGENAFGWCSGLTSIDIPNSVWRIDREAFFACSGLKSIKVEEGNPVYDSRDNCNAIIETKYNNLLTGCQNTRIPDSVTDIDYGAFYRCTDLKSITIPNSVEIIGESAFKECGLTEIISKIENPLAIDTNTFSDSTYNNATLYVPKGTIEKYKAQEGWKKFVNIKEK